MGVILNFSKWKRIFEQAEAEENNSGSMKRGELYFRKYDDDDEVIIEMSGYANQNLLAQLEFYGDKINVSSLELKAGEQRKRIENLTPSDALITFFAKAGLTTDLNNLYPTAKKLATLILNKTNMQNSPLSLRKMYAELLNSKGNILKGNIDWIPAANREMAKAVEEWNELNKNN